MFSIKNNNITRGFCSVKNKIHDEAEIPYWIYDERNDVLCLDGAMEKCPDLLDEVIKRNKEYWKKEAEGNIELTKQEINFIIESLEWAEKRFTEKLNNYNNIDGYYKNQYLPKIKEFNDIKAKLRKMKGII